MDTKRNMWVAQRLTNNLDLTQMVSTPPEFLLAPVGGNSIDELIEFLKRNEQFREIQRVYYNNGSCARVEFKSDFHNLTLFYMIMPLYIADSE